MNKWTNKQLIRNRDFDGNAISEASGHVFIILIYKAFTARDTLHIQFNPEDTDQSSVYLLRIKEIILFLRDLLHL